MMCFYLKMHNQLLASPPACEGRLFRSICHSPEASHTTQSHTSLLMLRVLHYSCSSMPQVCYKVLRPPVSSLKSVNDEVRKVIKVSHLHFVSSLARLIQS